MNANDASDMTEQQHVKISKTLSWALRHKALELGLTIDSGGWVPLHEILNLQQIKSVRRNITPQDIEIIVNENAKKRFDLKNDDGVLYIRAAQGHSKVLSDVIEEETLLQKIIEPCEVCVHGTNMKAYEVIKESGLKCMERMHVHFASRDDKSVISGMRSSATVKIYLDMDAAMRDGMEFFRSSNDVILSRGLDGVIDPKYFKNVVFASRHR